MEVLDRGQTRTGSVRSPGAREKNVLLFCVTVSAAHLFLSEEGGVGLRPPGSADGE